ncbi:hypothetical protein M406DRAFT_356139 [Cryphonectria parasitica EP155]|uniref:Uncharacterized protein n=1 Tax=Cryphonectria parasitica (strain ATCC 38755 / EP155) TaxID=660469 RepID=A0A9P4Y2U1_CRYP1|nr:uncharacterized protein M406DRAFT_356139 [Cryphonectria parasitica EP155]KAF3765937.1 hypothetical protein M406DRAFT_356139 [Cryphonectria parasitica EP155]
MVSQEITVNVRPAGDMSDVPARHSPVSSRHRSAEQSRPLIQRRGSEGGPQYHHHLHQAGPTGEANTPSPAEMKRPGAELGTAAAAAAHYPGGPSATVSSGGGVPTAGIEMKPLAAHRTSVHIGAGVQVSNVEAEKLTEVPTFVDELVGFCVEAR